MNNITLVSRLRNCLDTILELEMLLKDSGLGASMGQEFTTLRHVVENIEEICVKEDEVQRIEAATGRFLAELKETFGTAAPTTQPSARVLQ